MFVRLKEVRRVRRRKKWDLERLRRNNLPFQNKVEGAVKNNDGMEVNQRWLELRGVILDAAQSEIGYERKETIRKPWITKDMINKMKERKEWKS